MRPDGLFRHDGVMVASAISYSLIFALFPFAIFLVAAGAAFGGADLAGYLSREALTVLPAHVIQTLEPELNRIFAAATAPVPAHDRPCRHADLDHRLGRGDPRRAEPRLWLHRGPPPRSAAT